MNAGVDIQIVRTEYGPFPEAASLNPRIDARARLLRATLDVRWEETDPRPALSRLESTLARFSPSFRLHECRGPRTYHVFANQAPASRIESAEADAMWLPAIFTESASGRRRMPSHTSQGTAD